MTRILNRALSALSRVYRLEGGDTVVSDFETQTPIIPVHDVSREAELGAGIGTQGGWLTHYEFVEELSALGSTERRASDPWDAVDAETNIARTELSLWLYDTFMNVNGNYANVDVMTVALAFPTTFPGVGTVVPYRLLEYNTGTQVDASNTGASGDVYIMAPANEDHAANNALVVPRMHPFPVPVGSTLTYRLDTSGICEVYVWHLMWAGPRGVAPPLGY